MIKQYHTRRNVSVEAVRFDGTNLDEIEKFNVFITNLTQNKDKIFVGTTFGDGYMNIGDYLVHVADSYIVMTEAAFNSLFIIDLT